MDSSLIFIINLVATITVSIITVNVYLHFNINRIVNNQNTIGTQNIADKIVNQYLSKELSSDKINDMINNRIIEVLKDRPRIFTFKNEEEMIKGLQIGDIAFVTGAKYQNVDGIIREI